MAIVIRLAPGQGEATAAWLHYRGGGGWEGWLCHLPGGAGYPAGDLCWMVARVLAGNG
jgi:hypothetical protein